jgi:hypothetical protein
MINGEDEFGFVSQNSELPMYTTLGTPDEHKKHILYPGGHSIYSKFHEEIDKDILGWLDQYLGPISGRRGVPVHPAVSSSRPCTCSDTHRGPSKAAKCRAALSSQQTAEGED